MNKYTIRWIIALLSIALLGLLCVQLYWVDNAVDLKKELFRQSVNSAMSAVVSKLEKHEVASAVAQTVYAEAAQADAADRAGEEPGPPDVPTAPPPADISPAHPPAAVQEPAEPNRAQLRPRQRRQQDGQRETEPAVVRRPRSLHFTTVSGGTASSGRQPQRPVDVYNRHTIHGGGSVSTTVEFVHLDSMRNVMRLYFDSSQLRPPTVVLNRMSVGSNGTTSIASLRNKAKTRTARARATTVRDSALQHMLADVQSAMEQAQAGREQLEAHIAELDEELDRNMIHIETALGQVLDEQALRLYNGTTVEIPDYVPVTRPYVWVYNYNHSRDSSYAQFSRDRYGAEGRAESRSGAVGAPRADNVGSATAAASAPAPRNGTAVRQTAPKPVQPVAHLHDTPEKSDRDKLVSIQDMASRVVVELATGRKPIERRLSPPVLDSLLKEELEHRGITLPYKYAVLSKTNDFPLARPAAYRSELQSSAFRAALYPNDIIAEPYYLSLYFPGQDEFGYESMWSVLATSLAFLLLILGVFSFTLVTLARQKKLSDIKTDFINNMTHEFKTPIATISLASEALRDPAVRTDDSRVMRFINAIYDENKRLGSQVERVLQAAVIDRGEVRLNRSEVSVHDSIRQALHTVALQVESRGGTVECRFGAKNDRIIADRVHLANMITNLLDNANKYSPEAPAIRLTTENTDNGILISVEDNGIGMSRDVQKRIFEQFYRVPTGNVHDVKGFGLGLSYVKAMVEAHGGTIAVRSEPKRGSRFDLFFPFTAQETTQL